MHHVVQANLFSDLSFKILLDALDKNKRPYRVVKVVPTAHAIEPELEFRPDEKVFVWGSTTLGGIAKERDWKPGRLLNSNFDMRVLKERFGRYFLNDDARFCTFGELTFDEPMFCRPVHETKTFSGVVIRPDELAAWRERIIRLSNAGYGTLTSDTIVMYSLPKEIAVEARFFVINNKVVTGSSYRSYGNVLYRRIEDHGLFRPMIEFAEKMAAYTAFNTETMCSPIADAYVLDVALVGGEPKAVEVNCINSAGFYACNVEAVVRALEAFYA